MEGVESRLARYLSGFRMGGRVGKHENEQMDLNTKWQAEWRMDERVCGYMQRCDVRWVSG